MTKKITSVPIEHKVLAVIDNFQCDLPEIVLTKNLSIRRIDTLSEEEKAVFSGEEREYNHFSRKAGETEHRQQTFNYITYQSASGQFTRTQERANYVLYWYFKARVLEPIKQHYDVLFTPNHEFGYALSALRVLKDAVVGLYPEEHFLIDLPLPKEFPRIANHMHNGYPLSEPPEVDAYMLLPEEVETFEHLLSAIRSAKQPGLLTALARLDNQYSRAYLADRLIDAVIALEALYAGDNLYEIALRVGLRISAHLGGSDADQRERYFDLFNLAYSVRSRLVHGSIRHTGEIEREVKKKGWQDSDAFMADLDNMLRQSLRSILLHVKERKLKELLHEPLDKAIRRGEVFRFENLAD